MVAHGCYKSVFLIVVLVLSPISLIALSEPAGSEYTNDKMQNNYDDVIVQDVPLGEGFFTQNLGQWNSGFMFIGDAPFGQIALGKDCIYFNFRELQVMESSGDEPEDVLVTGCVLKYIFEGANYVEPYGSEPLMYKNNYLLGNKQSEWATGAVNYQMITYENIWDGIDLFYYFDAGGPKYEFVLKPGANLDNLKIRVEGHSSFSVQNDGLIIDLPTGQSLHDKNLRVYYNDNKKPIDSNFKIIDGNTFTFDLGQYDIDQEVIIDPLVYSTYVSGSDWEHCQEIAHDASGNAYVTGYTLSKDFPKSTGAYDESHNGDLDVFVFKLNAAGTALTYCTYVGGTSKDWGYGIDVDSSGNAYVAGCTESSNFPNSTGPFDDSHNGNYDVFVFKLDTQGKNLVYSTFVGSTGSDVAYTVKIDSNNHAYVTGRTASSNFPKTSGVYDESHNGQDDVFVLKLNASGDKLIHSTFVGGITGERGYELVLDSNENVFVTGYTDYASASYFPTSSDAYDKTPNGWEDVFVFKLNASFDKLTYSTLIGGAQPERGLGIDIDTSGNAYVTGWTLSNDFPTVNAHDSTYNTNSNYRDAILFKVNATGTGLYYSTYVGGSHNDESVDIAVDPGGNAHIIGKTGSKTTFPISPDAENSTHGGGIYDIFYSKMNASGDDYIYSTFRGGSSQDYGYAIDMDSKGGIYCGGVTSSSNFPVSSNAFQKSYKASDDTVMFKFSFQTPISPPQNLHGIFGNGFIDLSWEPPVDMAASKLLSYNLYRGKNSGTETLLTPLGNVTSYNDTSVDIGLAYYYYVTAVNATTESYPSNEFEAADAVKPQFGDDNTPTTATTGDEFTFSISASDNILLSKVFVEYWYGQGDKINLSMDPLVSYEWTKTIIINHTLEPIHYVFLVNDTFDNWNTAPQKDLAVVDNDKTVFSSDNSDMNATTGEDFTFDVEVTDNIAVSSAWLEYWYGSGSHTNISLNAEPADRWTVGITVDPNSTDKLHYSFHANDTYGNWNETLQKDITVIDNDRPTILLDRTAGTATTGDNFTFDIQTIDNVEVEGVWVEYWYGSGTRNNESMTAGQDDTWQYEIKVIDHLGKIHYIFRVKDTGLNWNQTDQKDMQIYDNDKPELTDNSETAGTTGEFYKFSISISDNIGVSKVHVEYWFGDDAYTNSTLLGTSPYEHTITIPINSISTLYYIFSAADTSDNWISTKIMGVGISDNDPPTFSDINVQSSGYTGSDFNFYLTVEDNIGVLNVSADYWFEGGTNTTVYLQKDGSEYSGIINIPSDTISSLMLTINAKDAGGNVNSTTPFSVLIVDNIPPIIEAVDDLEVDAGSSIDIAITANDNIGIVGYSWEDTPFDPDWNTLSGKVDTPGTYEIKVTVEDAEGNHAETSFTLKVNPKSSGGGKDKETAGSDKSNAAFAAVGIIIVIVVIVVIVLFLMMKKKKKENALEEPAAEQQLTVQAPGPEPEYPQPDQVQGYVQPQGYEQAPAEYPGQQPAGFEQTPQAAAVPGVAPPPEIQPQAYEQLPAAGVSLDFQQQQLDFEQAPPAAPITTQPPDYPSQQPPTALQPDMTNCPQCGVQIPYGVPACPTCGTNLTY